MEATPVLHLVTCGSVDDGKSTLIGRLLAETDSVPVDQLEYARTTRRGGSTIPIGEVDFSLLTDGLEAEREQGITIDVAYRHMNLPNGRRVLTHSRPLKRTCPLAHPWAAAPQRSSTRAPAVRLVCPRGLRAGVLSCPSAVPHFQRREVAGPPIITFMLDRLP